MSASAPSFISAARSDGTRTGILLENLKRDVDRPLAAILSLNTIAHTVGAAGVGAQAQAVFGSVPVSVISGVLTLLILVFSEIIPKTLGAVTLEDTIETLIGEEIMDEGDEVEDMRAYARDAFNRQKDPSRSQAEPPG